MPYREFFLVPDYYPDFSCKCGDCRTTCCSGWTITLSEEDYFRVFGADCPPDTRRRLDVAFCPVNDPSPDRYMKISYNWLGECPLRREDGLCALHRDCGEAAIPEICRRFPRAPREKPIRECCTSTSCEFTLELLFAHPDPVKFVTCELTFLEDSLEEHPAGKIPPDTYRAEREAVFSVLADRTMTLDARLRALADVLGCKPIDREAAAERMPELFCRLAKTSTALTELAPDVDAGAVFPLESVENMEIYLEKMLVNHAFYKAFPHSFANSAPRDELAALVAVRELHRYVASRYLGVHGWSMDAFVDVTAKLFRMIEHSRFDEVAARFLKA